MDKFWRSDGQDTSWSNLANWWDALWERGAEEDVQAVALPVAGDALYFLGQYGPGGGPAAPTTFAVVDTSNLNASTGGQYGNVRVSNQLTLGNWNSDWHDFNGTVLAGCAMTKAGDNACLAGGATAGNNLTIPFDLHPAGGTITIGNGCTLNGGGRSEQGDQGDNNVNIGTDAVVNANLLFGYVEYGGGPGVNLSTGARATINAEQNQANRNGCQVSIGADSHVHADIRNSGGADLGGGTVVDAGRTVTSNGQGAVLNVGAACALGAGSSYTFEEGNGRIAVGDNVVVGDGCSFRVGSQNWEQNGEITWGGGTVLQGGVSVHANAGGIARLPGSGTLDMKGNVSCVADKPEMTDDGTAEIGYSLVKTGKYAFVVNAPTVNLPEGFAAQITDPSGSVNIQGRPITAPITVESGSGPFVV